MKIKNVVVIGSGTMGSGIAAHLCNANIPVTLLDLKTEISQNARERIHKSRPPLLIDKTKIDNIKVGNISDDFDVVKNADWIVEAVVERIDIKHQIYDKIFESRKDGAIVSSNTSSIPIKVLSQNLNKDQKKDFCITHFFNPVRYMGLLEIVKNEDNDLNKINQLKEFCEVELGKGAIVCNDTPGFLGNRVGVYAMQIAMTEAFKMKLSVEEADAIFGRPMGIPKTGVFGLYDLIGIDLMADVLKSFIKELPKSDEFHEVAKEIPLVKKLIETGYTGRKGKGGFYRMKKTDSGKIMEAINLETGEYSTSQKIDIKSDKVDLKALINKKDDQYDALMCVGTFTFGHVKPPALDEFIRITKNKGLICFTINEGIYEEYGFDKKIKQLKNENKWKEIEFFKSDYIASKDVNAWLGLYEVTK